jgi:hypothetical protein
MGVRSDVTPKPLSRLVPVPRGFDDDVKAKAAQAERSWELVTGSVTFLGAGGGAAIAAGLIIPPIAPFAAVVAAGSFYFKLRAKWAKEDPPRPDYDVATDFRSPQLDLMVLMPPGPIPPGAAVASLLFAAATSVEATIVTMERAMGASVAARPPAGATAPEPPARASARIADMLDDRALGHVIASGIDARLLDVEVWRDPDFPTQPLAQVLADAGKAAEQFGASLARWTQDVSFGGPGTPASI